MGLHILTILSVHTHSHTHITPDIMLWAEIRLEFTLIAMWYNIEEIAHLHSERLPDDIQHQFWLKQLKVEGIDLNVFWLFTHIQQWLQQTNEQWHLVRKKTRWACGERTWWQAHPPPHKKIKLLSELQYTHLLNI